MATEPSKMKKMLEIFDVGPCEEPYQMGFLIGQRFSDLIKSRVAADVVLQHQLLPFACTPQAKPLIESLCSSNKLRFPAYWDELLGTAQGSGVSTLELILVNLRKEMLPFVPKTLTEAAAADTTCEDCSDVLVVNNSMAILAHNEDANSSLVGHTYLVRATLPTGMAFTAYTYAGELPSCAFGFNTHGMAFTLNAVPPSNEEISTQGIGRNFISRHLLEATDLLDALNRVRLSNASVGHSYNLVDTRSRRILNVETASGNRFSVREAGETPFFHANMYLHLNVHQVNNKQQQSVDILTIRPCGKARHIDSYLIWIALKVENESSISRQARAALLTAESKENLLALLGDCENEEYPIYMTGPTLYTLCTVLIDLDDQTLSIFQGNPKKEEALLVFPIL